MKTTEERLKREKDFHNETFSADTRKAAKKYYNSTKESKKYYKERILEGIKGKKVLEYGCGPGSAAFDLARAGAEVYAIDISDVAINQTLEKALKEGLTINAQVMDAEELLFEDHSFDCICGSGILHHLDLKRAYSEINRSLKKNGKAVFFEPLGHNFIINLYRNLTPKMRTDDEHPLLMSDLKHAEDFFEGVNLKHFNLFSIMGTFLPTLNKVLSKMDYLLFKMMPFMKKYSWIVVIDFTKPK